MMCQLPKRDRLDPVQAAASDFAVARVGNFCVKGEAGTGRSVVSAHVAAKLARSVGHLAPVRMMV